MAGITLSELLKKMIEMGGSDLHITTNSAPRVRVHGRLRPLDMPPLTAADTKSLAYSVLTDAQKHRFEENLELDFSFGLKNLARFRGNVFQQRGAVGAVFRTIPWEIKSFDGLGLAPVVKTLCEKPRGLVLVTGPTGSGKSTTLAAMLDKINNEREEHMITIEDPIEFLHNHKKCLVNQREVHSDTHSFASSLRAALREDPDVVLIGEMRDLETIESALRIAETGHLTFATLHTNSALSTINRVVDVFPAHQQPQIRAQLSMVLEGILCQALLPRADGRGRIMVMEILIPTPAIRNLIREDKIHQIYSAMQTGTGQSGMQTFNQSLANAYFNKFITLEMALSRSSNADELQDMINRGVTSPLAHANAPVRRDDRCGPAVGAVPGNPRGAAGEQDLPKGLDRNARRRRRRIDSLGRHAPAREGVRPALRQHGRSRRDRRYSGHYSPTPVGLHREKRQVKARGEVRVGLPRRGPAGGHGRHHPVALEGGADLRHTVHRPGSRPALAHAYCHDLEPLRRQHLRLLDPGGLRRNRSDAEGMVWHPQGSDGHRCHAAKASVDRNSFAQDCGGALYPYVRHIDQQRRAHPGGVGHHRAK